VVEAIGVSSRVISGIERHCWGERRKSERDRGRRSFSIC